MLPGGDAPGGPPTLTPRVYENRRPRPCLGSRDTHLARHDSDGYPNSAITLPGVMPSLKYKSTALCLCSLLNTTDSNLDAHASNILSAPLLRRMLINQRF